MNLKKVITCIDVHTAGEPARIITGGLPPIPGGTMLEKRAYFEEHLDLVRKLAMREPRGHADMYGCVLLPPVTPDGHFGILFLHNEGYATMCGHASIAAARVVFETGMLSGVEGINELRLDTPAGRVACLVEIRSGKVCRVSFDNVPTFVHMADIRFPLDGVGEVTADVVFCGGFFVFVDAAKLGLEIAPRHAGTLFAVGRGIKRAVLERYEIAHPEEPRINGLYGVVITEAERIEGNRIVARNVCVSDAGIDRSPCGTGTSGRLTLLHARGVARKGMVLEHRSIIDTVFEASIKEETQVAGKNAIVATISGNAFITGFNQLVLDSDDTIPEGFYL